MTRLPLPKSLQARLLVMLLGVVAVVWLGASLLTWVDARHELDELLDGHLAQAAALLVVQQTNALHDDDDGVVDAPSLHKYAPRVAFQVFHEGHLVMRSSNADDQPMSARGDGFSSERFSDGSQWRVFTTRGSDNDVQVYVAEQAASRSAILWAVLWGMLLPLAIGHCLAPAGAGTLVGRAPGFGAFAPSQQTAWRPTAACPESGCFDGHPYRNTTVD